MSLTLVLVRLSEDMDIRSLARVPEEALILKIGRHRFGHGNGTIIALEEMTLLQDLYKLKDFYLLAIVSNKPVHMLGKNSHLANNGNLLQQLVSVDELIMDKVLDQVDISPIIMLIDVDKANTVPTYISGESEQPEIYMTTVTQWDPGIVEFYKPSDQCFAAQAIYEAEE